jgi:hypothetical protein
VAVVSRIDCLPAANFRPSRWWGVWRTLLFVGMLSLPLVTLASGIYAGTRTVTSWSYFTRPDGTKLADENEDIYCKYLTLHGTVTRKLSGRFMVWPYTCPWFDPGPLPLPKEESTEFTPASSYLRLTHSPALH